MSKCRYTGEFCPFTNSRLMTQLKQPEYSVTFYDALFLALNVNTPIETLIFWAKRHLKKSEVLITTRGHMTVTQMVSQLYQNYKTQKAWKDRHKIEQEMKLFEQVHEKYRGPGENAILLEIAKRKNQLELAKLYEPESNPEPVEDHEELIRQYEKSTEALIEQRRAKEERMASDSPPPSSGSASPNYDAFVPKET